MLFTVKQQSRVLVKTAPNPSCAMYFKDNVENNIMYISRG